MLEFAEMGTMAIYYAQVSDEDVLAMLRTAVAEEDAEATTRRQEGDRPRRKKAKTPSGRGRPTSA